MTFRKLPLSAAIAALTAAMPAAADTDQPLPTLEDGAHVTLSGKVTRIDGDEFVLDYGTDSITVELEDFWNGDGIDEHLRVGDSVMVSGEIDDDLFEARELEADNLYSLRRFTYYIFEDEPERYTAIRDVDALEDGSFFSAHGEVIAIDDDELEVRTSGGIVTVDTDEIENSPLGDDNPNPINIGDRIYFHGEVDDSFWDEREIDASVVMKVEDASDAYAGQRSAANR